MFCEYLTDILCIRVKLKANISAMYQSEINAALLMADLHGTLILNIVLTRHSLYSA